MSDILVVPGLSTPNQRIMDQAIELFGANADVFTLDPVPAAMEAPRNWDIPATVTDAQISAYLRHVDGMLDCIDGLVVVNPDTELLTPQGGIRIGNSVGRIALTVMNRVRPRLTNGHIQLTHALPQRLGDASARGMRDPALIADERVKAVTGLRPQALGGKIGGVKLGNATKVSAAR